MSAGDPPVQVSSDLPGIVASAVKQAVDDSRGLGLTWTLRLATVIVISPITIIYDGDTETSNAVSMIGPLRSGQRVYCLIIPPSGNFVVGATEATMSRGFLGANSTNNGTVCTTPGGGAETAVPAASWDIEPMYSLINNRIYRADLDGFTIESTGTGGAVSLLRLRKGSATTSGTQLGLKEIFHPVGFGGLTQSFTYRFYFKNTSGALVQTKLSLTINGVIGAGTWSLYGDTNDRLTIAVNDCGSVSDNTGFANLLTSV